MRISLGSVVRFGGEERQGGLGRISVMILVIVVYLVRILCLLGLSVEGAES